MHWRNGFEARNLLTLGRKILIFLVAVIVVLLVLAFLGLWYISNYPSIPGYKPIEEVVYLNKKEGACRDFQVDGIIRSSMPDAAFDETTRDPNSSYQGWCEPYRQVYYRLPQGTTFFGLRYDWVASLERPVGREPLLSRQYMESIGYIYDGAKLPNDNNPADLPIGLTWHYDSDSGHKILDVTCAACHSSQLTYQGKALQIDGGSGSHALTSTSPSQFIGMTIASVLTTYLNPVKFHRFSKKVLAEVPADERSAAKLELRSAMWSTLKEAVVYGRYNNPWVYPTDEGYGRTDGLARILNTVFGDELDRGNDRTGDAPVNYPHLWDIWSFDWVQWMGSVSQAMARNLNESLGVRAELELKDPQHMFSSSALLPEMHCIETVMQHLEPPAWPEDIFGVVDRELSEEGKQIFAEVCQTCHGPFRFNVAEAREKISQGVPKGDIAPARPTQCSVCHGPWMGRPGQANTPADVVHVNVSQMQELKSDDYRLQTERNAVWQVAHTYLDYIGTDPTSALNFINNTYDLSALKDTPGGKAVTVPESGPHDPDKQYIDDWKAVSGGVGLRFIGGEVRYKNYAEIGIWDREQRIPTDPNAVDDLNGFGEHDRPKAWRAYRPRPLEGVWATAPYLHNGSVPTLYQLLLPADQRDAVFYLGRKEYDPKNLGLRTEKFKGAFRYDTHMVGNSNYGHEFNDGLCGNGVIGYQREDKPGYCRQFTERERRALLEYIKVHSDAPRINPETLAHCEYVRWPEAKQ